MVDGKLFLQMALTSRKRKGEMKMRFLRVAFASLILMLIATVANAQFTNVPTIYYLTTTYTNASVNSTNVTGLVFPVNPGGSYHATCHIIWNASVSTATPKYFFVGPLNFASATSSLNSQFALTSFNTAAATTFASTLANTTGAIPSQNFQDTLEFSGINTNGTAGTVQLQAAAFGAGTLTIQIGSNCSVQ